MTAPQYELTIREMKEGKETYFLGTIRWLDGFLVEGDTPEQVKEIAPALLVDFLEVVESMKKAKRLKEDMRFILQAA